MRLLIATDAWYPQVNGVVRSLEETVRAGEPMGLKASFVTPAGFRTWPLPFYPEIQLALTTPKAVARAIEAEDPDTIHIATEGPIGVLTRLWCLRNGVPFTTSYHTRFPEYLRARAPVPLRLSYAALRRFHAPATVTMVSTPSLKRDLEARGFAHLGFWAKGVDTDLFTPDRRDDLNLGGPVFLYVGRVAVEKNVEAFLALDLPGRKVVVGDGPQRADLEARFPDAAFLGVLQGEALARVFASADVFVFPSLTDTYGLVQLEALASGVPVAAFPVAGPLDVLEGCRAAALDPDLKAAALRALDLSRTEARAFAERFSWSACARQFIDLAATAVSANRRGGHGTPAAIGA